MEIVFTSIFIWFIIPQRSYKQYMYVDGIIKGDLRINQELIVKKLVWVWGEVFLHACKIWKKEQNN